MRISNGIQNRNRRMPNGTYGGVRGRKTKVGRKLLRFPPTRLLKPLYNHEITHHIIRYVKTFPSEGEPAVLYFHQPPADMRLGFLEQSF